jgi:streptogramin lyase
MFRAPNMKEQNRNRVGRKTKRRSGQLERSRRLWLEPLEDRTLLDINFATMARSLSADLGNLTSSLSRQFFSGDAIPLVGNQLSKVDALSGPFHDLTNALSGLGVSSNPNQDIQRLVQGNVTAASVTPSGPNDTQVDVSITFSATPGTPQALSFDLSALNNFLHVNSSQNFQVSEGFSYTLTFHYDDRANNGAGLITNLGGPLTLNVTAQSTNSNQLLTFSGTLNNNPDATHSSLYVQGSDINSQTRLSTNLGVSVDPNTGAVTNIFLNDGVANLDTHLNLRFGDPSKNLPFNLTPQTDLLITWSFSNNAIVNSDPNQVGQVITAQFQNVTLDATNLVGGPAVDGFAGTGIVDSAIERIHNFAAPFQPVASFLNTEIPGLDALGLHVRLADLFGLGSLVSLIDAANSLPSATGSGQIQYGTLTLASDPQTALADLRNGNLAPGATSMNVFEQADGDTGGLFRALQKALNQLGDALSSGVDFPLIDDGSSTLFDILEGRISPLFNFQIHFNYSKTFELPPIPVGFVPVVPSFSLTFGMDLTLGYDTTGLKTASGESNPSNYTGDLLDGFFLTTGAGQTDLSLSVGFSMDADAILAEVGGSIIGNISLTLNPDPGTNIKRLDTDLIREIKDDPLCALELNGSLSLEFHIKAGFFVGPVNVTAFEIDIGPFTLVDFGANCSEGSPAAFPTIPVVDNSTPGNHTILIHNYLASDPQNPGGQVSGVEVEDNGMVQRYATTRIAPDGTKTSMGQTIQQIVVYPQELLGKISTGDTTVIMRNTGADEVNFGTTVLGGPSGGDYVNVLMVGSDTGNDNFEYDGNGQAILIGGKKTNTLVGGQLEFGGGLPYGFLQDVRNGNYSDFPGNWVQNIGDQLLGYDSSGQIAIGNPITISPQLDTGDGPDSLTGTPTSDVLYGGSSSNVFIGEGGGDTIRGDEGDPYAGSGGIKNTFLESALAGYPTINLGRDTTTDQIYGSAHSNSTNYLQFTGFLDGSYADNISLQKESFPDPRPIGVDVSDTLPDGSKKDVQASGITSVLIDAGTGNVVVGDLSSTLLSETDINYEILPLSPIAPPNTLTVDTDIGRNDLPHQWTIKQDDTTGGIGGIRLHSDSEGDLVIQHLINDRHYDGGIPFGTIGQLILDDTARPNTGIGVGATFNVLSLPGMPVKGPALTINLGGGAETVNLPKMENSFGTGVTVHGGSGANGGLAYDTLSLASGDFDWDIEPTSVSISQSSGSPPLNTVFYSGMNELDIETFSDIQVAIGQNTHTLDGLPGVISLAAPDNLPSFESLFIDDQNTTDAVSWKVRGSEIDRITSSTVAIQFVPSHFGQANFTHIDGGIGGSVFDLTPPGVEQGSEGNLDGLRGTILTITGHGTDDSLIADDENVVPYSDATTPGATTWTVDGSHVSRSYFSDAVQDTTVAGFDFFNIQHLALIGSTRLDSQGNPVANSFTLSQANENLDEMPGTVGVRNAANLVLNDQNSQAFDVFGLHGLTTWQISGSSIVRSYPLDVPFFGGSVTRTFNFDAPNVTINGDNFGNKFVATPDYTNSPHLPRKLTLNGGTGGDSLLVDDTGNKAVNAIWKIDQGVVTGAGATIDYNNLLNVEVDGGVPTYFFVKGTPPGMTTTLVGAAVGGNTFSIGDSSFIQGPLVLHGNGTGNVLDRGPDIREFPFGGALSSTLATVSAGADEGVWFSKLNASALGRITTLGQITEVPSFPADSPDDVVTGPDGNLYFINQSTNQILRLDLPSHNVEVLTPSGVGAIRNLVAGNQHDVWFTLSNFGYSIGELDTISGNYQLFPAKEPGAPFPMTVLPNGSLVVVYTNSLHISTFLATIPPGGPESDVSIQSQVGTVGQIVGMAADPRGNLWATAEVPRHVNTPAHGKLFEITLAGVVTRAVDLLAEEEPVSSRDDIAKPGQIVLGSDGALWFTDSLTTVDPVDGNFTVGQLGRFDPASGLVEELALPSDVIGDPTESFAITSGPDGNIWFTEPDSQQIGEIIIPKQTAVWQITGTDKGQLYSNVAFDSIQNLNGGLGGDTFGFLAGSSLSGKLTGGFPTATLDESQNPGASVTPTGAGTLHGQKGTATNILGGFDNIDTIFSNTGSVVVFDDSNDPNPTTWTITPTTVTWSATPPVGAPVTVTAPIGNASTVIIKAGSGAITYDWHEDFVVPGDGSPSQGVNIPIEFDLSSRSAVNSLSMMDNTGLPDDMVLNGNSLITEVSIPALDAAGKDAAKMTINFPNIQFPTGITLHPDANSTVEVYGNPLNSPTTVKSGGNEAITVGNGVLDALLSSLHINSDPDTLVVNDQNETNPETYTLTSNSLTRTGSAPIMFSGLGSLIINGGSGGNTFDIVNTPAGATTTINSGTGNDFVNVIGDASYPSVLYIDGVGGSDVVTIGSLTPDAASFGSAEGGHVTSSPNGGGTLANIQGPIIVHNSSGQTALIVDEAGVMAPVRTIGFGLVSQDLDAMSPATGNANIYYNRTGQVQSVTYFGPQVGSSYTIYSTNGIPNTYLNLGPGNDTVVVLATLGPLTINGGGGNDTVTIGGQAPVHGGGVSEIGPSVVLGNPTGTMALTVDDSNVSTTLDGLPNTTIRNAIITATSITGMPAETTIDYTNANLTSLTILGGAFGNVFEVKNTPAGANTTLNSGNGVDTVYVEATTGPLTVNTQQSSTGTDFGGFEAVYVGKFNGMGYTLDAIQGALTVNTLDRPGTDYGDLAILDNGATASQTYTLANHTFLRSGAAPIYYTVTNELFVYLGSGGNKFNLQSLEFGPAYAIFGGVGNDMFNIGDANNTLNGIVYQLAISIQNPGSQVILHDEGGSANFGYSLASVIVHPTSAINLPAYRILRSDWDSQGRGASIYITGPFNGSPPLPLQSLVLKADSGNNTFNVQSLPPGNPTVTLDGGGGTNTLQGPNQNNSWQITAPNAGSLDTNVQFGNMQNLGGGTANDTFAMRKSLGSIIGGSLSGSINGGGGTDTLDYSGYTGDVTVNMRLSAGNGGPGTLATGVAGGISRITNVFGSIGNDLIVGDANSHTFVGGTGRNIIIGGAASDTITGGGGDNILIGGTTIWDTNPVALQAIMQEWTNTTLSFDARVNALKKGITVGGQTYALNTSTVMKDSSPDNLIGGVGQNWFFFDFDDIINNGNGPGPNDRATRV